MVLLAESMSQSNDTEKSSDSPPPRVHGLTKAFASGLYSGFSPVASGTVGSAIGLAVYWIPGVENPVVLSVLTVLTFALAVPAATAMEAAYGHDPGEVTIDEVVGMWISLMLLPKSLLISVLAFFLFRIFDIVKPYPARLFDRRHGGLGIMLDDVVAALYTNLLLHGAVALKLISSS